MLLDADVLRPGHNCIDEPLACRHGCDLYLRLMQLPSPRALVQRRSGRSHSLHTTSLLKISFTEALCSLIVPSHASQRSGELVLLVPAFTTLKLDAVRGRS